MRDLHPKYWLCLPIASFLICVAVGVISPTAYRQYIRKHEVGLVEHGTVVCAAAAVALGVTVWRRRRQFPAAWLAGWSMLITLGAFYFGGEECSWGQNYFKWATPESWSKINDQDETNLHNLSAAFDQLPRDLLTAAAAVGVVAPLALLRRRRRWDARTNRWAWLLPTTAVVPAALLAILVGIPQKLYGRYDDHGAAVRSWFSEMFLNGRHSELKECFLAMFIMIYLWSLLLRLRTMDTSLPAILDPAPPATASRGRSAGPTYRQTS